MLVLVVVVDGRPLGLWDSGWSRRSRRRRDGLGGDGLVAWRGYRDILFLEHDGLFCLYMCGGGGGGWRRGEVVFEIKRKRYGW